MSCKLKIERQLNTILTNPKISPPITTMRDSEYRFSNHCHFNLLFIHTANLLKMLFVSSGISNPTNAAIVNADKLIHANTFTGILIFVTSIFVKINYLVHFSRSGRKMERSVFSKSL